MKDSDIKRLATARWLIGEVMDSVHDDVRTYRSLHFLFMNIDTESFGRGVTEIGNVLRVDQGPETGEK